MAVVPLSRSRHLLPLADYLNRHGAPVDRLLEQAGLPGGCLETPQMLVPSAGVWRFRALATTAAEQPDAARDAMDRLDPTAFREFGRILSRSSTLRRLLTKFHAFARAESSTVLVEPCERNGDEVKFEFRLGLSSRPGEWESTLYVLGWMIKSIQLAAPNWTPTRIWTSCRAAPDRCSNLERLGAVTADFGRPTTGFEVPTAMLALPVRSRIHAGSSSRGGFEDSVSPGALGETYADTLRQALTAYKRWFRLEEIAEAVGTRPRTLQRRLAEEQTTYAEIIDDLRSEAAARLLRTTDTPLAEIAQHLGYSNQGNFYRAFSRWAGTTPLEFRRRALPR